MYAIGRNYRAMKETGAVTDAEADTKIKDIYTQLVERYPDSKAAMILKKQLSGSN